MFRRFALAAYAAVFAVSAPVPAFAQDDAKPAYDTVLMTVNGEAVTLGEAILLRQALPQQYQNAPDAALWDVILQQLRNQTLLAQTARAKGVDQEGLVKMRRRFDERSLLGEFTLRREVDSKITEEAIQEEYANRFGNFEGPEEVRASHILRKDKAEIDDLKTQLDTGADFAELAKEWGTDGTKDQGGDLGWFQHGAMVKPFADAAFAMEEGAVSDPVETRFGWHLILVTGKRVAPAPALEQVRGEIAQDLSGRIARALLDGLAEGAEIVEADGALDPAWIRLDELVQP